MNNYKKTYLSNKIPLLTVPIKGAPTATALIMFKTGSRYENKRNNGLSHFLEHMFFKGTVKRPNTLAISSELDSLGGEYNAFTSKEFTGYWVKVAAGKLTVALDIISDMLLNSRLAAEEIEREKGVIIEELNMYEDIRSCTWKMSLKRFYTATRPPAGNRWGQRPISGALPGATS
jgi:predicted Zn-dependent peptidase